MILRCCANGRTGAQDALVYYNKITQINPNNELVRKRKAEILVGQKKYNEALDELKRAEQVETNPADTRTKIGLLYVEQGELRRRRDRVQPGAGLRARQLPRPLLSRHRVHRAVRIRQGDRRSSDKIPDDNEHYVESRLQLAYPYDKENDYDEAIAR